MNKRIIEHIFFVLEDDNEVMTAALEPDSDLDDENRKMNRELIKEHEKIIDKVESGERLTNHDLDLIRDANEIHVNDVENLAGHHSEAVRLNEWLEKKAKVSEHKKMAFDKEGKCLKCGSKVSFADVRDTLVFVGDDIVDRCEGYFGKRKCVRCVYPEHYGDYECYDKSED